MNPRIATKRVAMFRAGLGAVFALFGIGIAVQLLLKPEPMDRKWMGLAFALVLVALGAVRIRAYLQMRGEPAAESEPGP